MSFPVQLAPLLAGAGFVHVLVRFIFPSPQVTLHNDHTAQFVQSPSTTREKRFRTCVEYVKSHTILTWTILCIAICRFGSTSYTISSIIGRSRVIAETVPDLRPSTTSHIASCPGCPIVPIAMDFKKRIFNLNIALKRGKIMFLKKFNIKYFALYDCFPF